MDSVIESQSPAISKTYDESIVAYEFQTALLEAARELGVGYRAHSRYLMDKTFTEEIGDLLFGESPVKTGRAFLKEINIRRFGLPIMKAKFNIFPHVVIVHHGFPYGFSSKRMAERYLANVDGKLYHHDI